MFAWIITTFTRTRYLDAFTVCSTLFLTALLLILLFRALDVSTLIQDWTGTSRTVSSSSSRHSSKCRRGRSRSSHRHRTHTRRRRAVSQTRVTLTKRTATGALTHVYTARTLEPRYRGPPDNNNNDTSWSPAQRQLRADILQSRNTKGLRGPFGPWLAVPSIGQPAHQLGLACRYGTSLSRQESELIILWTAAKTRSHAEFDSHVPEALAAGVTMEMITSIPRDEDFGVDAMEDRLVPLLMTSSTTKSTGGHQNGNGDDDTDTDVDDDDNGSSGTNGAMICHNRRLVEICRFATELLDTSTVSTATYENTKAAVGGDDAVLVEITSIVGYYTYVAYTLNVFRLPSQ